MNVGSFTLSFKGATSNGLLTICSTMGHAILLGVGSHQDRAN